MLSKEIQDHIDSSLTEIRAIFEKAANKIEAIKPGEKIPATALAKDLGIEYGMTGPALYPTLKFLFESYPGVDVKRGAQGGICRPAIVPATPAVVDTADGTKEQG